MSNPLPWVQTLDGVRLSTARLSSGKFQTIMEHPEYNDGRPMVVANTDTVLEAERAHNEWAWMVKDDALPDEIYDENESPAAVLADAKFGDDWRVSARVRRYRDMSRLATRADLRVPSIFLIALGLALILAYLLTQ